ncbi:hypothetical protein HN958_01215 [Candidatus Falkowbacteria bacterium]|jgi:hypothetical protein|nr:hypothetical protein [Candidatus Falkowbacteria bacterium]MBT7007107.1 hypothetical protein [Candidatus Falkowbacteria bacterium]
MKNVYFVICVAFILIVTTGCVNVATDQVVEENQVEPLIQGEVIEEVQYDYSADLEDVTGGLLTGKAYAQLTDNQYTLFAYFNDLPEITDEFFYEGWIVRKSPLSVLSTGKAFIENGRYENNYVAEGDLTDHDFYVLTVEPDDGDPAPADHVLEGTLRK